MRYTNPQLVAKCEQILCVTSSEFEEEQQSQNLLLKVGPLSTICNIMQGEKLEISAKLTVFVSNILSLPPLKQQYTRYRFLFLVFRCLWNKAQHIHLF